MSKRKKIIKIIGAALALSIIFLVMLLSIPKINSTWVLAYAQKAELPQMIVAHNGDYDFSNDPMYIASEPVELIWEAKGGELTLTDRTNGTTYEGTYIKTSGLFNIHDGFIHKSYAVVINGIEGTANFSSRNTLFVSIGGYYLTFEK